ncbi:alpha-ketoglutarate-dependent dioxygenase AlkB family protein [Shewanella violacea]|uniref:Alkylated DNA repair protein, putative n=1 Tax=Shewanella violacea (strain JCM 10179 / CIP 106290 / LMG 19151 / DSS12) TaxID=637905 RepID=D4ZBB9_SHEVD|nr:alpha-ketoglutarate-dependent dioxygenase AlkB [Shewanella violacea]BAJ03314.1 alkylated DNA repair protein, putative [Shewanella violacea DSS12]
MKQQSLALNGLLGSETKAEPETESLLLKGRRSAPQVTWVKGYLAPAQQMALLREVQGYPFESPEIQVYGKRHRIPRSQVWFADAGCDTRYSGLLVKALYWPKYADRLRQKLKRDFNLQSNGVLVNRYADGKESMGWHCDDEPEFLAGSDIASITLGATRDFIFRDKVTHEKQTFALQSGDLLIMHWPMQDRWEHALPKRMKVEETRINYTFRQVTPHYFD